MTNPKNELKGIAKSFFYAFKGIAFGINNERNVRIHICVTLLVTQFAIYYRATKTEFAVLLLSIGLIISAEMINTSLEALVNLSSPQYNSFAKIAKDVAAGAVLVSAFVAVIIGGLIFLDFERLKAAFAVIFKNVYPVLFFAVTFAVSSVFVVKGPGMGMRELGEFFSRRKKK